MWLDKKTKGTLIFLMFSFLLVCNVGYFMDGDSCTLCTGNTIKLSAGNATVCDTCDGTTTVPNADRTACGELELSFPYSSFPIIHKVDNVDI